MDWTWEKKPETEDQCLAADFLEKKPQLVKEAYQLFRREAVRSVNWTSPPLEGKFFTFEVIDSKHEAAHLLWVWYGIRAQDGIPLLTGRL